eukprot:271325-Rhodomonas_salina.1
MCIRDSSCRLVMRNRRLPSGCPGERAPFLPCPRVAGTCTQRGRRRGPACPKAPSASVPSNSTLLRTP